jgi:hypothetical protein
MALDSALSSAQDSRADDADGDIMADDPANRTPADLTRVNLSEPYDVAYRCKEWGCTPVQLRIAVAGAKTVAADIVERYLKAQGWHK